MYVLCTSCFLGQTAEDILPCSGVLVLLPFGVSGLAVSFSISCQTTVCTQRC